MCPPCPRWKVGAGGAGCCQRVMERVRLPEGGREGGSCHGNKIKSMHPAGRFGGKLGLARAEPLHPLGGRRWSPQPGPRRGLTTLPRLCHGAGLALTKSRNQPSRGRGAAGKGSGATWKRVHGVGSQPVPSGADPREGRPALLQPRLRTSTSARTGTACRFTLPWSRLSVHPSTRPPSRCLSPWQCPERWPQLRWQRPH